MLILRLYPVFIYLSFFHVKCFENYTEASSAEATVNYNDLKTLENRVQEKVRDGKNLDYERSHKSLLPKDAKPKTDAKAQKLNLKNSINVQRNLQSMFETLHKIENSVCRTDMTSYLQGLMNRDRWALQLFDALPKFPIGLMYGNMYQLGNFEECIDVNGKDTDGSPVSGQYCLADIAFSIEQNISSLIQPFENLNNRGKFNSTFLHLGICLPSTCKPVDTRIIVHEVLSLLMEFETLEVYIEDKDCYFAKPAHMTVGEFIFVTFLGILLTTIIFATIFHIWFMHSQKNFMRYNIHSVETVREHSASIAREVLLSFSLIQTVSKFLQTRPSELNLECICGIKVLSMIFILGGHSLLFIFGSPFGNADFPEKMSVKIENSIFVNNPLLVDSFLLVSGFLMCRLLLIELDKRTGRVNFLVLYIARYIRLTPSYMVVIALYLTWLPDINSGPLWGRVVETENVRCRASWWTNLLYINNYVQTDKLCMFQAWYLAADYHLFIIAPFLIFPLWRWPKFGFSLLIIITVIATVLPGYITYSDELDPTLLAFPPEIQDLASNSYFVNSYIKTHMRASSYFLGLIFGYAVHKIQMHCYKIPRFSIWVGWILTAILGSGSMCSIVLFMDPNYIPEVILSAIYAPLHRLAWALSVGWVILACVTENSAIVNKFLSWKAFVPLSRLTYCAYLINGLVLLIYKGTKRDAISWTKWELGLVVLGHVFVTFFFAFFLCICCESPIHGLEKILLRKKDTYNKPMAPTTVLRITDDSEINK